MNRREAAHPYPPIGDYALIGDCHSVALVSRQASIDWCCMPRLDSESCFGRLLDWEKGGYCSITPTEEDYESSRRYLEETLVLETRFRGRQGEVRILDCFAMRRGGRQAPHRQIIRVVEGLHGRLQLEVELVPRFSYGAVKPWLRCHASGFFSAIGGTLGLIVCGGMPLEIEDVHDLRGRFVLHAGERVRLSIEAVSPHQIHPGHPRRLGTDEIDRRLDDSIAWWRRWSSQAKTDFPQRQAALRSAITIKALINAPTGAIAAAPTTSLPEVCGGSRNWDYRYSWSRDSSFALESLEQLGFQSEAQGFRYFVERTTAGNLVNLQVAYGIGGELRLTEWALDDLEGYRGSKPVRVGNAAYGQRQLDIYGELLDLAWRSAELGYGIDEAYWAFLYQVVQGVKNVWYQPDCGIWELRGQPRHFVYSKVMCWAALDRGLRLAEHYGFKVPTDEWTRLRDKIRQTIERHGVDAKRGVFIQAFESPVMDAALLLLPRVEFIPYDDERMLRTVAAVREELEVAPGLLRRYRAPDGLAEEEGVFLTCAFWLVECLARQGDKEEARHVFDQVTSLANDLGLFAEEAEPKTGEMLGNFPQALTHYSHISAILTLNDT
jgi:GH15 family glucan-1,4-alpha-glucosidase